MLDIPFSISLVFILTTLAAYLFFIFSIFNSDISKVSKRATAAALLLLLWLIFQSTLALNGWYMDRKSTPPHLAFPVIANALIITLFFVLPRGRRFIDGLSLNTLLLMHVVRVPVEICLYWLAVEKQVPWSMTFYGFNFDIIFGISAPVIWFLNYKGILKPVVLKVWNYLALLSVAAVVIRGIGAAPSSIQWWDFSQPNYAVMHFPFIWLPSFIVPFVILAHLTVIRRLRVSS